MAKILLAPAKGLTPAQRRAVERDYGMCNGHVGFPVRQAMITYVAEALGVLDEIQGRLAKGHHDVHCLNAAELEKFVPAPPESDP
jgi:hypothetical protein